MEQKTKKRKIEQKGDWYVLPIGRLYLYLFCVTGI